MNGRDFIGFFGWVTALTFALAVANFFVKYVNKKYISKLGKEKVNIVDVYRKIMKLIVKNHRLFGIIAIISLILHATVSILNNRLRVSGMLAAILMVIVVVLGIYGAKFNKNIKGKWLKTHRMLALILIISIAVHVLVKAI
ncbi:MAG: hypothetical protein WBH44_06110 [Proteocatella sp.]